MSDVKKRATTAQAHRIAYLWTWGREKSFPVGDYVEPTTRALIKHKWMEPAGDKGEFPTGEPWTGYRVSAAGLLALENYLRDTRMRAPSVSDNREKARFRVGEDHFYYGGPDYKCVTAEQCAELERRFADAEREAADNREKVAG